MEQQRIVQFAKRFFTSHQADILKEDEDGFEVRLTETLDKALMNRPFYWQYMKQIGQTPEPMILSFVTSAKQEEKTGEWLHIGSPRLQQIFQLAKNTGIYTCLYEQVPLPQQKPTALYPWLIANVKVSYLSHQRKDVLYSYGLQLIHGQIVLQAMEQLQEKNLREDISPHAFTMKSLIKPASGLARIKRHLEMQLQSETHEWAAVAKKRMEEELDTLKAYYEATSLSEEEYVQEKKAIMSQYQPNIQVTLVNYGLFYLQDFAFSS